MEGAPPGPPLQYQHTVEHAPQGQPLQYQPTVEGAPLEQYQPDGSIDPLDPDAEPRPWYRRPITLIGWAILVLILLALIAYGVSQLIGGGKSTTPAPTSTSTSATTTETTSTTTTTTTTEPTTTTTTEEPGTTPTAAPPPANPPRNQPPGTGTTQPHRPHLPNVPSTITVPGGPTITLPNIPR